MSPASPSLRCFFFSSRRRHTRYIGDWSSDVCSSDLRRSVSSAASWCPCSRSRGRTCPCRRHRPSSSAYERVAWPRQNSWVEQIGRASCRERVWVWVGAIAFKRDGVEGGGGNSAE